MPSTPRSSPPSSSRPRPIPATPRSSTSCSSPPSSSRRPSASRRGARSSPSAGARWRSNSPRRPAARPSAGCRSRPGRSPGPSCPRAGSAPTCAWQTRRPRPSATWRCSRRCGATSRSSGRSSSPSSAPPSGPGRLASSPARSPSSSVRVRSWSARSDRPASPTRRRRRATAPGTCSRGSTPRCATGGAARSRR